MGSHALALGLVALLVAPAARGEAPGTTALRIALSECASAPIESSAFLAAVELETGRSASLVRPEEEGAVISVRVDCDGKATVRTHDAHATDQREFRLDDVPGPDRARVIALVLAELLRSNNQSQGLTRGEVDAQAQASAPENRAAPRPVEATKPNPPTMGRSSPPFDVPWSERSFDLWGSATLRASVGGSGLLYGASAGIALGATRLQAETELNRVRRPRGEITSGVAALRTRRALGSLAVGSFVLEAAVSGALGVTWATGDSEVPGTVVRRVLLPYADARFEVAGRLLTRTRFAPELGLYAGRAAGLLAKADGDAVIATGGWLVGTSVGSTF